MKEQNVVFYRKYRPFDFEEVLGQEHVVSALKGALKQKNIAHAYLFSGSRGTGKTSIARILARAVGISPNDLYEIDAASNRGIDDVRALKEAVNTLPFESPYKAYIIDEVHMLTKEAFNALLKTLEEPPKHVIFMLATTEPEKLPETIISRCEVHTFKKPNQKVLKKLIEDVAKKEGYKIEGSASELIALLGDGSFRDTHGILQKVIGSVSKKEVKEDDVRLVTGAPKRELVNDLVSAIDEKNTAKGLETISKLRENNIDTKIYLKLLLHKVRAVLLLRYAPDLKKQIESEVSEEDMKFLEELSGKKETNINSVSLSNLLDVAEQLGKTSIPELPLELAIIKITNK